MKRLNRGPADGASLRTRSDDPSGVGMSPISSRGVTDPKISLCCVFGSVSDDELQNLKKQVNDQTLQIMNIG